MKTLQFFVTVEDLPDHAKHYRVGGTICTAATKALKEFYEGGAIVIVSGPVVDAAPTEPSKAEPGKNGHSIFYLWFDPRDGRWQRHDYGLHCGDCFEALIEGTWRQTRIEHSSSSNHSRGWFLVTHPNVPLEDLPVRKAA